MGIVQRLGLPYPREYPVRSFGSAIINTFTSPRTPVHTGFLPSANVLAGAAPYTPSISGNILVLVSVKGLSDETISAVILDWTLTLGGLSAEFTTSPSIDILA